MISRQLFTKPGLSTLQQPVHGKLLEAFGIITSHCGEINLFSDDFIEGAVEEFGLTRISNQFKKLFAYAHSKGIDPSVTALIVSSLGPIFPRFSALQLAAHRFQTDHLPEHLIKSVWQLMRASDGLSPVLQRMLVAGPRLIISYVACRRFMSLFVLR